MVCIGRTPMVLRMVNSVVSGFGRSRMVWSCLLELAVDCILIGTIGGCRCLNLVAMEHQPAVSVQPWTTQVSKSQAHLFNPVSSSTNSMIVNSYSD